MCNGGGQTRRSNEPMCLNCPQTYEIISRFRILLSQVILNAQEERKQIHERTNLPFPPLLPLFLAVQGLQAHPGKKRTLKFKTFF